MTDFLKSAFGYFGSNVVSQDNDFVGQNVELGDQKLRVKRVIAEGSCYGFVLALVIWCFLLELYIINRDSMWNRMVLPESFLCFRRICLRFCRARFENWKRLCLESTCLTFTCRLVFAHAHLLRKFRVKSRGIEEFMEFNTPLFHNNHNLECFLTCSVFLTKFMLSTTGVFKNIYLN